MKKYGDELFILAMATNARRDSEQAENGQVDELFESVDNGQAKLDNGQVVGQADGSTNGL